MRQLMKAIYQPESEPKLVGRRGQKQSGIDVVVDSNGVTIGIQCKRYDLKRLTKAQIENDLRSAEKIDPPIDRFVVAATTPKDAVLEQDVRRMTLHGLSNRVQLWCWGDIIELLADHQLLHLVLSSVPAIVLQQALDASLGLPVRSQVTLSSPPTNPTDPLWLQKANDLLGRARPGEALLGLMNLDSTLGELQLDRFLVAKIRCLIQLDRDVEVVELIRSTHTPSSTLLALGALAAIETKEIALATQWIERAKATATEEEREWVWASAISLNFQVNKTPLPQQIEQLPDYLRSSGRVAQALGDAALMQDDADSALHWYGIAEAAGHAVSTQQRLMRATAYVAWGQSQSAVDEFVLADEAARERVLAGVQTLRSLLLDVTNWEPIRLQTTLLTNLSLGEGLLGNSNDAVDLAMRAARLHPALSEGWYRALYLAESLNTALPIEFLDDAPEQQLDLLLLRARAYERIAMYDKAKDLLQLAAASASLPESQRSLAEVGLHFLANGDALDRPTIERWLTMLQADPSRVALASPLLRYVARAADGDSLASLIIERIASLATHPNADYAAQTAFAGLLRDAHHPEAAVGFIPAVRKRAAECRRLDSLLSGLLIDLLIAQNRYREAETVVQEWRNQSPLSLSLLAADARLLTARGLHAELWNTLANAIQAGANSAALLGNFAQLSWWLAKLREGRSILRNAALPAVRGSETFHSLFDALARFNDPRLQSVIDAGLQPGAIDNSNAGAVFVTGIRHLRGDAASEIANDTLTKLDVQGHGVFSLWIGDRPAPISGVATYSPSTEWLQPLIGRGPGESVELISSPFPGTSCRVIEVLNTKQLLLRTAGDIGQAVPLGDGGFEKWEAPSAEALIDRMTSTVLSRNLERNAAMKHASEHGLPAIVMAKLWGHPRRRFFGRSGVWRLATHRGTKDAIDADDRNISATIRFVLDATSVLMIVELGGERLIDPSAAVTPQTLVALWETYLLERESLRSRGHLGADHRGRLVLTVNRSRDRIEHRNFWVRVKRFLAEHCEVIEVSDDEAYARVSALQRVFDASLGSSWALAIERGWTLLSEENAIRDISVTELGVSSGSIQRLIAAKICSGSISGTAAARLYARLIDRGGAFTVIPIYVLGASLRLPPYERRSVLRILCTVLREAQLSTVIFVIACLVREADAIAQTSRSRSLSVPWLIATLSRELRRRSSPSRGVALGILKFCQEELRQPRDRTLRRMLQRFAMQS